MLRSNASGSPAPGSPTAGAVEEAGSLARDGGDSGACYAAIPGVVLVCELNVIGSWLSDVGPVREQPEVNATAAVAATAGSALSER